ncbi:DUF4142 domain-containing protein [Flavobacterium saccharophilum]|uniref:DUF4142 domain-containing protein n=1 Tax=Flavobacterium saccharophilum TaxID=29534 RepID=A0A1M7M119_9FLAO|nr:DUF4142 domain-containing protein [Flavobacterium saccharophilum]SHM83842.1 protein of unknown function [Flavobacterium saccharophilum]
MKTIRISKAPIFKVLFLLIFTICFSSCGKKNQQTNSFKKEAFNKSNNEELENSFFIEMGNVMNSMISKSQVAQQKSSDNKIVEVSKKIADHQIQLLQQVTEMANKKLIIITDINAAHKQELTELSNTTGSSFNDAYLSSMTAALDQQIKLLEQISKRTNDQLILKLVLQYLPEQYQLLRETEQIKNEFY